MLNVSLHRIKNDLSYVFINGFVNHIPAWWIRRLFYKGFGMKIGKDSRIAIGTVVVNPSGITIGARTIINEKCHLDGRGKLTIGDDTSISFGTVIITASHKMNTPQFDYCEREVNIEDHVWIGAHAIILDGTKIAHHDVIGAGAVLKGNTQECGVYTGNPATFCKDREKYDYCINYHPLFR